MGDKLVAAMVGLGASPASIERVVAIDRSSGAHSKAETANPKDLIGAQKVALSLLPAIGTLHGAHAMMDGAAKYGPYNWRAKKVQASIYVAALKRHVDAWFDGEETATDSGVHHLGHAIGCLSILLDAQETGNLIDDRPVMPGKDSVFARVLARLNGVIKSRAPVVARRNGMVGESPTCPKCGRETWTGSRCVCEGVQE